MENRKWGVRIMEAKKYRRIFTIVVDSCGIGGAKDAERFGDAGTDTLGHIAETVGNLSIPNMQKLGIANLKELKNIAPVEKPMGYFTRLSEASNGKDTMTGHWEMMGLHITKPFLTFTEHGFPKELIDELEKRTGHKVIGNKSASGTGGTGRGRDCNRAYDRVYICGFGSSDLWKRGNVWAKGALPLL